jgi:hypothetical protein
MARTILHQELGVKPEVIEHQLAHRVPDALGTAYNRTKFLPERWAMMQQWADYLNQLKAGEKVIPMPHRAQSLLKGSVGKIGHSSQMSFGHIEFQRGGREVGPECLSGEFLNRTSRL